MTPNTVGRGKERRFSVMQVLSALLLLVGLFFLAWWILQLVLASPLQPVDVFEHDFGTVIVDAPDTTVEYTFVLENTSVHWPCPNLEQVQTLWERWPVMRKNVEITGLQMVPKCGLQTGLMLTP